MKFAKFRVAVFFPFVDDQQVASGGSKACALNFTKSHFNNSQLHLIQQSNFTVILTVVKKCLVRHTLCLTTALVYLLQQIVKEQFEKPGYLIFTVLVSQNWPVKAFRALFFFP